MKGFTSIIFEILERVPPEQAASDEEALKFHYHDMVSDNTDTTKFWDGNSVILSKLKYVLKIILQVPANIYSLSQGISQHIHSLPHNIAMRAFQLAN
jgi:hypothetical protein